MGIKLAAAKLENSNYLFYFRKINFNKKSFIKNKSSNLVKHKTWFRNALKNTKNKIFIIKFNEKFCGYLRLEKKNKEYVVSILIDVKFRKKGLATKALILAEKKLDINSVLKAEVNFNNMASIAMFSKMVMLKNIQIIKF